MVPTGQRVMGPRCAPERSTSRAVALEQFSYKKNKQEEEQQQGSGLAIWRPRRALNNSINNNKWRVRKANNAPKDETNRDQMRPTDINRAMRPPEAKASQAAPKSSRPASPRSRAKRPPISGSG